MTTLQYLAGALRLLPRGVRTALYTVLALVGVALAACDALGVKTLGAVSLTRALQIYAYVSPAMGVVAVANVTQPTAAGLGSLGSLDQGIFDGDTDLSSFEPVGEISDIFGLAPAGLS